MKRVIIFGGQGFIGSEIVRQLNKSKKFKVLTAGRSKNTKTHLEADITNPESITKIIKKGDLITNLVGLSPLRKPKNTTYKEAHVQGVKNIIKVCKKYNCKLIHMSALGAEPNSKTEYLRTKYKAETLIKKSNLKHTIFKPSVIYDKESEIIKSLIKASKFRIFPKIPAKLQPVYRKDIAKLFVLAINNKIKQKVIEVGGPETFTFYEMAKLTFNKLNKACIPIPLFLTKLGIILMSTLHIKGITLDNLRSLNLNNTTTKTQEYIKLTKYSDWLKKLNE